MNNKWTRVFIFSVLTAIFQVVFVNNINFLGTFNPKFYPIFLLLFPKNTKPIPLMIIGLAYGFIIDMFSYTLGIGMAASVLICFLRPYLFKLIHNKRDDEESVIRVSVQGFTFIVRYLAAGLLIFHLTYFIIELGEFVNIFYIIWKSLLSAALSLVFYLLYLLMFSKNFSKRK